MADYDRRPPVEPSAAQGLPALLDDWRRATLGRADATDAEVREVVERYRPRVAALRDPFTPIARGDASARAGERVLWEDERAMVIVDRFASGPKLLVVPKQEVMFPVDAPAELMQHLARVCAAAAEALRIALGATMPARCWINPPAGITVRQLHVHVLLAQAQAQARAGSRDEVYTRVSELLRERMG